MGHSTSRLRSSLITDSECKKQLDRPESREVASLHNDIEPGVRPGDSNPIKSSDVDVLIIGAGPAGLMAAASLTKYGVHNIRVIDKRSTKIFAGHADGLNPRSLEIFEAMDMKAQLDAERFELGEIAFWNVGQLGTLQRTGRIPDTIPGISHYRQSTVHQGRIERMFLDKIKAWSTPCPTQSNLDPKPLVCVERGVIPETLHLPAESDSPLHGDRIVIKLRRTTDAKPAQFHPMATDDMFRSNVYADDVSAGDVHSAPNQNDGAGEVEEVRAKFVIGADGARSWTRKSLGFKLEGDSTDYVWGVVDGRPVTDFPDIRLRCAIHSADSGSVMVIPRERNLVRLYIQIPQPPSGQRINRSEVSSESLLTVAKKIMAPFSIDIPHVEWFTCYEIGQRLANQWVWNDRIFIAGDACHTHSPKAGQGMNISMADTFNLCWKLAHVLQGKANPKILSTYYPERYVVAEELLDFDHKFARLFSGKPQKDVLDETGISLAEFKKAFEDGNKFSSGTSVDYSGTGIFTRPSDEAKVLAPGLPVGMRLKSFRVVCLYDARSYQLAERLPADGRWRIMVFAGDVREPTIRERLDKFAEFIGQSVNSPVVKYTTAGTNVDSTIEVITIVACPRIDVEGNDFPEPLRPKVGQEGYQEFYKLWADDAAHHHAHGRAYEGYGIDPKIGCLVVVRPDQHVSLVTTLDDFQGISSFFDGFMIHA